MVLRIHTCLGSISTSTSSDSQKFVSSLQLVCLCFCLYYYVIHICFYVLANLFTKACLDSSLVSSTSVLESKRHGFVAVGAKRSDKMMSCSGPLPLMRFDDILNINQEKTIEQIMLLNQLSDQCVVVQTDISGNVC
jgi:hypothetical protein